ncbi:AraC family transcriptional regulator [Alteribacter keqinensis]|uniref:AraC family transcriptional regulator n=1 Tax=Alteribacter keqinensis TaxID=2483800 RepID=A0A3M7TUV5_9BACI|nr:AraC family transcriptional regulator [Alteribacter keqinensis]RNA68504.1 AraC family transcriptional regulator [Alteribacter keqinensis]
MGHLEDFEFRNEGSYAYRFQESEVSKNIQLWSIGWDTHSSQLYKWNGLKRKDTDKYIFQYTVRGYGKIKIEDEIYTLDSGTAFMVTTPGDYEYYLPEESSEWEFIYITLYGDAAKYCWGKLTDTNGSILRFHPESRPIQTLLSIYAQANEKRIDTPYIGSSLAYQMTMSLLEFTSAMDQPSARWHPGVAKAINHVKSHFAKELTIDTLAWEAGLSPYHFSRLFKQTTGYTPLQYVTFVRMYKAADLVLHTNYTFEEIARKTGYANANYMNKVFKKLTGISPREFRKRMDSYQFDELLKEYERSVLKR